MPKRIPISAIRAEVPALALKAMHAALTEYEEIVVTEAQNLAPVYDPYKKTQRKRTRSIVGTDLDVGVRGRGSRMIVHRSNRRRQKEIVLGRMVHFQKAYSKETREFRSRTGAQQIQTEVGRVAERSGHGSRPKYATGYRLGPKRQERLTSRARYNLARGIGVHRVGEGITGASASRAGAGAIVFGGALRDSIHGMGVEPTENGLEVRITASVRYAPYVEFGTYKDYAQPFLRPAIKNSKKKLNPLLKKHLRGTGFTARGG